MNLANIIESIKENISNIPSNPICIYIGVGSAAGAINYHGVKDIYYHQYPKCIESIRESYPDTITFHILIDPMMESPPFMTTDRAKFTEFELNNDWYHSMDNKHFVYCLKQAISTIGSSQLDALDITKNLHALNQLAIDENILLVYNDFTGQCVKPLADYFDKYIVEHLDHIIYGIGNRCDQGCYIDLLHPSNQFIFSLEKSEKRDIVKILNIYHLYYNKMNLENSISKYPLECIDILTCIIESVLQDRYEYYINQWFYYLRIVHQLINGKLELHEINKYQLEQLLNTVPDHKDIFKEGNYSLYFTKQIEMYSSHLDIIRYIKNIPIDNISLLQSILSDKEIYRWSDNLKRVIDL